MFDGRVGATVTRPPSLQRFALGSALCICGPIGALVAGAVLVGFDAGERAVWVGYALAFLFCAFSGAFLSDQAFATARYFSLAQRIMAAVLPYPAARLAGKVLAGFGMNLDTLAESPGPLVLGYQELVALAVAYGVMFSTAFVILSIPVKEPKV